MTPDQWAGLGSLFYLGAIGAALYGLYVVVLGRPSRKDSSR
jgi:hypothetical protein